MVPPPDKESTDIFPMPIACTGCATRYRIDKPRAFTCPHCGNHIEILADGRMEIIPKRALVQDITEIEEPPSDDGSNDITGDIKRLEKELERKLLMRIQESEPHEIQDKPAGPKDSHDHEEEVISIKPLKKMEPVEEPISEAEPVEDIPDSLETVKEPVQKIVPEVTVPEKEEVTTGTDVDRETREAERLKKEIRKEEARLERLRREQEELEGIKRSHAAEEEETEASRTKPVLPSYYSKAEKGAHPLQERDIRKKVLIAIGIVAIILTAAILYSIIMQDDFSVKMPEEKIDDRGTYNVKGKIWASSPDGISTGNGVIQDLVINLNGQMIYQINETVEVEDGFGIEKNCIDKYLWQNLKLSGSVELITGKSEISDAGRLIMKSSSFTDLVSNETILNKIYSDLNIDILSYFTAESEDLGLYYPSGDGSNYDFFDLREREYKEGDEGDFAGGQLRWKAEEVEKVNGWDCLRLHITENNSDAAWRDLSGDIWVANECSLPVKVYIHTKIDTSKLNPTQKFVVNLFTPSDGKLELDYTATMKGYTRGDQNIPWDPFGNDPSVDEREGVQFDKDWKYGPLIRNDSMSFDPKFSPEIAAEFAVNESSDLRSYVSRHEDEVYVVDGKYSVDNGTQYWELLFGYRVSGLNTNMQAYNITIKKEGDVMEKYSDPGDETINNPSNSRDEIEQALNIADAEGIYKDMKLVGIMFGNGDSLDFDDETNGTLSFEVQNNYLHTGLTISTSFNPFIQNSIPAGYGYYLKKERTDGDEYFLTEGMLDAQNGRIIYELNHYQDAQF